MTVADLRAKLATLPDDAPERAGLQQELVLKSWPLYAKLFNAGLKDKLRNLKFRKYILQRARADQDLKTSIKIMCKRDLLFWINTQIIGFEPRTKLDDSGEETDKRFAFITRPKQDEILTEMAAMLGREDFLIEKSRDEGATWSVIQLFTWRVQFYANETFLMISRREEDVYKKGAPKALFSKLKYLLDGQPKWLAPYYAMSSLICTIPETGGVITGESTNEFAGSGDRVKACLFDELAKVKYEDANSIWQATSAMTHCRIANSTHLDENTKFFELRNIIKTKFKMGWWDNPDKNKGLYLTPDGKRHSPWYEAECKRLGNATAIKQELDIDPVGSDSVFFEELRLAPLRLKHTRPPLHRFGAMENAKAGMAHFDYSIPDYKFRNMFPNASGPFLLWVALDKNGRPPRGIRLNLGCDLSTGSGQTNSSITGINGDTGEQVLEYTTPFRDAYGMAEDFIAIWHWWCDGEWNPTPYLIWEVPGPGQPFGAKVQELGFSNVWYRPKSDWDSEMTLKTGWTATGFKKKDLLVEFRDALQNERCQIRDEEVYKECLYFKYVSNPESVEHSGARHGDASGARSNHGDRVIGAALAWLITKGYDARIEKKKEEVPENSMFARMQRVKRKELEVSTW